MGRAYISKKIRELVKNRASKMCEYCLNLDEFSSTPCVIEHIIPIVKDGTNNIENLAYSCQGCNGFKHTKTFAIDPKTGLYASLYNPRTDTWKEHFIWNDDFTLIIGTSMIGRATIEGLKLNRQRMINQREAYTKLGIHPPKFTI